MINLPRFAGLEKSRNQAEREEFVRVIAGAGYDPIGVGAVIETESAGTWSPSVKGPAGSFTMAPGYPVGLIQFAPSTAQNLGTSTAELERMSFVEQLPYIVKYYDAFGGPTMFQNPGDYYVAGFGAHPRTAGDRVLAVKGSAAYDQNRWLDNDANEQIEAYDLRNLVNAKIDFAKQRGTWVIDERRPELPTLVRPNHRTVTAVIMLVLGGLVVISANGYHGKRVPK